MRMSRSSPSSWMSFSGTSECAPVPATAASHRAGFDIAAGAVVGVTSRPAVSSARSRSAATSSYLPGSITSGTCASVQPRARLCAFRKIARPARKINRTDRRTVSGYPRATPSTTRFGDAPSGFESVRVSAPMTPGTMSAPMSMIRRITVLGDDVLIRDEQQQERPDIREQHAREQHDPDDRSERDPEQEVLPLGRHAPEEERARPAERGHEDLADEPRSEREQRGEDGHVRDSASRVAVTGSARRRRGLTAASRLGSMSA